METFTKPRRASRRNRLPTSRSLSNAEKAIAGGERTIGEISEMVQLSPQVESRFDSPLPDIDLVTPPPPAPMGEVCRATFGMSVAPLLFCMSSLGAVAGVFIGISLDGSAFQKVVLHLLATL